MMSPEDRLRSIRMTLAVLAEIIENVKDPGDKEKLKTCLKFLQNAVS